jgi:predicted phage replisome organizer
MSINKKYYYLKFKENYFDQDHIRVIESMTNGYEYSLIILKLYLKAVKFEGQLKVNEAIPYTAKKIDLLAGVLGHDPANVMHAINLAVEYGVIDIMPAGEIFMTDIQNLIGHGSTEAERKAKYRQKLTDMKKIENKGQCPGQLPPEIEIEKDIDIHTNFYETIFKKWISHKELMQHKSINTFKKQISQNKIKDILEEYSVEEVCRAIHNYHLILINNEYAFTYNWALWDFLNRGLHKFVNQANPFTNYKKRNYNQNNQPNTVNRRIVNASDL